MTAEGTLKEPGWTNSPPSRSKASTSLPATYRAPKDETMGLQAPEAAPRFSLGESANSPVVVKDGKPWN